ncbi:MAG TPA: hypothetical protein VHV83_12915 [Armatimonadota bacterium]|nr:hypothetical protein [Armatimonadota bacterium]
MNLDIRLPMGIMFSILGALLAVFGLLSSPNIYNRSLGININLWWGAAILCFGLVMVILAVRARSRDTEEAEEEQAIPHTENPTTSR